MLAVANEELRTTDGPQRQSGFPEWAATEVDRLLAARAQARTPAARAEVEYELAVICDVAQRFGRSLADASDLT